MDRCRFPTGNCQRPIIGAAGPPPLKAQRSIQIGEISPPSCEGAGDNKTLNPIPTGGGVVVANDPSTEKYLVEFRDFPVETMHLGPVHGPSEIVKGLPEQSLAIPADMAFHARLFTIFKHIFAFDWVESLNAKLEPLAAPIVIAGHGHLTHLEHVRHHTCDYLGYFRNKFRNAFRRWRQKMRAVFISRWKLSTDIFYLTNGEIS